MEKYRKSNTLQPETPELQTGQIPLIKVNAGGKVKNYVNACSSHFKKTDLVYIYGLGQAINKAVSVAEVVARNYKGSTMNTIIFEVKEIDVWESINGDLDTLEVTRHLPGIRCSIQLQKSNDLNDFPDH